MRLIIAVALLITALPALAQSPVAGFVFTSEPQTLVPGDISEGIGLQMQDSAGNPVAPGETVDLVFSSTSSNVEFLSSSGSPVSTVWNSNWKNRTFYYRDSFEGTHTLKVKATGRNTGEVWEASQQITVGDGVPSSEGSAGGGSMSTPSPSVPYVPPPSIKSYAGEDKVVVAGAWVEFLGSAFGFDGKPLENARFWWNFGDGSSKEGRSVSHIYQFPGVYTVGLHISSGEYAASDYLRVEVVPNKLIVVNVLQGEAGFIRLKNGANTLIDMGGWFIEDSAGRRFVVPPQTKIAGGAELSLPNELTGLFLGGTGVSVTISYPNGREAVRWDGREGAEIKTAVTPPPKVTAGSAPRNEYPVPIKETAKEQSVYETAAVSASTSPSTLIFVLAAALGILAAGGFLFIKWRSQKY